MAMVKINLLQQKKAKPISIPFGWIFVALYAVAACGALSVVNNQRLEKLEEKNKELEDWKNRVKQVKQFTEQKKAKQRQKDILDRNKNQYERILGASATGTRGWTEVLLWFEDAIKSSKTVWLRDLRIEGDGRVQLNGISKTRRYKNEKQPKEKHQVRGITDLLAAMEKEETKFRAVRLKRITWEPFKSDTVASFEVQCQLAR